MILQATENLSHLVVQAESGWEPILRIGVDNIMNFMPLYELIKEFQMTHPHVDIKLVEESFGGTFDALDSDRVDITIGAPEDLDSIKYQHLAIGKMDFVFAVAKDHPLTKLEQPISLEDIKKFPSIVVADSSKNLPPKSSGIFEGQRRLTVATIDKKIDAHLLGLGVGYLPLFRIQEELEKGQLVTLQTSPSTMRSHTITIAWKKEKTGKAFEWFLHQFEKMDRTSFIS